MNKRIETTQRQHSPQEIDDDDVLQSLRKSRSNTGGSVDDWIVRNVRVADRLLY